MVGVIKGLEPGKRPALLISECQRGILDPSLTTLPGLAQQVAERGVLHRIAQLAAVCRAHDIPVFHVHIGHLPGMVGCAISSPLMAMSRRSGGLVAGTPVAEVMPEVAPQAGDIVCSRKAGLAMWYGTDLDSLLRNCGVRTLLMTGVSSNIALFGGTLGGVDRGYQVVIPEDATAGTTPDSHRIMIETTYPVLASITTTADVIAAISANAANSVQ
ncbi:MAG: cysteine hydrolase [Actinomycetota bacterium]|nr:cysteine hydrolase [Actinomycetota bacterium]